jgi:hypothetical protein
MNFLKRISNRTFLGYSIVLLLTSGMISCNKENSVNPAGELLPAPRSSEIKDDISLDPKKIRTIFLYAKADENASFTANLLKEEINRLFSFTAGIEEVQSYEKISGPAIVLGIPSEDQEFAAFCSGLPSPEKDNEEAYVLDINERSVIISGGGKAGLFYGVQTLIQLMEEARWGNSDLQGLLVRDWPGIKLRAVHYNYFFHLDRFEYLKDCIKQLARYKVNAIVMEFEDRFKYQSHPVIAAPTSFTSDQVRELTNFAHQYHIDIIPLVQGLGHAEFILKHDEFRDLREDPAVFQSCCPLREGTYDVLFDMYRETIEATPGVKYFHIGGDEVRLMGVCPQCKKKKEEIGELGLYLTWLNRVNDFMKEQGRTLIFWDDMPLKQAGLYRLTYNRADEKFDSTWTGGIVRLDNIINKFPRDGIFMRWNYETGRDKGNIYTLDWYKKNDFKVAIATAIIGNWPLIPDYRGTPSNIRSFVTLGAEKNVFGELCTAWGDDAGNHSEIYWLGFLASAEYAWNSDDPVELERYWQKYIHRFFGPRTAGLDSAFFNLSARVNFWNTALMTRGMKNRKGYRLVTLPDFKNAPAKGTWTEQFRIVVEKAASEKLKCAEALETLDRNMKKALYNNYNLEVFASMGRLMEAHCDLVLTIGEIAGYCDKAINAHKSGRKEEVLDCLGRMADSADQAIRKYTAVYENVREVWEVSRYPKGEEGYIMNTQTNYLAGWTPDLSYLILAEKQLDLPGYAEKMKLLADKYKKDGTFSGK